MSVLSIDSLHLQLGREPLFEDVSFSIERGDKAGIVGPNGSGKSTLLKLIARKMKPDLGHIHQAKETRLAYFAQDIDEHSSKSLIDFVLSHAPNKDFIEGQKHSIEAALHNSQSEEEQLQLAERLIELTEQMNHLERDFGKHAAERVLFGLGFQNDDLNKFVHQFSGGWQVRARLGAVLYTQADILLLDEPTNHLDVQTVVWLSRFLKSLDKTLLLITHDRSFLNKHVSRIISIETDGVYTFPGNYDRYLIERQTYLEHLERQRKKQEIRTKELEAFVERFRAKASKARQAQSKAKIIEKMEAEQINLPPPRKILSIRFLAIPPSDEVPLQIDDLSFAYPNQSPLFENVSARVMRGGRYVLVGKNGVGKTTFLRLLAKELDPLSGKIRTGPKTRLRYFAQHHADVLNLDDTLLESIQRVRKDLPESELRATLAAFLFGATAIDKKIRVLSGGERTRVALAHILIDPGNILLLDEPTNHLDIESADALLDSLKQYPGTIIFVSHDQNFAEGLGSSVLELEKKKLQEIPGTFSDYMAHFEFEEVSNSIGSPTTKSYLAASSPISAKSQRIEAREQKKQVEQERKRKEKAHAQIESTISELEIEKKGLEKQLEDPSQLTIDALHSLSSQLEQVNQQLENAIEQWTLSAEMLGKDENS